MSRVKLISTAVILMLVWSVLSRAEEDYERHIRNLAAGTPAGDVKTSFQTLETAGLVSFSLLVAHVSDSTAADRRFQRDTIGGPTIGQVCFDLVQSQIEGVWPKAYREFYVLTPGNVGRWLEAHPSLTLPQLRRVSREESLQRAQAAYARDPSSADLADAIVFLKREVIHLGR